MKYLLVLAMAGSFTSTALAQHKTNEEAIAYQKSLGYSGYFNHQIGENRSVSVSYSFTPLMPTSEVNFMLHTPTPRPLSFTITDASGKIVAKYKPEENKYLEKGSLDISHLKPGKYEYKIYWDTEIAYKIPFVKK